eukprot:4136606-Pyramimonas_sp.AAC.1
MPSSMSAKTTGAHLAGSAHMLKYIRITSVATVRKHPPRAARFRWRGGKWHTMPHMSTEPYFTRAASPRPLAVGGDGHVRIAWRGWTCRPKAMRQPQL